MQLWKHWEMVRGSKKLIDKVSLIFIQKFFDQDANFAAKNF
jgi:hypothetical protein